jgi:hypothetical protein
MQLSHWNGRLNVVGATAVANLAGFGLLGILHVCLFPYGVDRFNPEPPWKHAFAEVLVYGMAQLAFPAGWVGVIFGDQWAALLFVPLNAYFWGVIAWSIWRPRIQLARPKRETLQACSNQYCSVHFAVYLKYCPACGASAPEPVPIATMKEARPSIVFILTAAVAAPTICGGAVITILSSPQPAGAPGALLAGAAFIALLVRWLNHRDSPRSTTHLAPKPDL